MCDLWHPFVAALLGLARCGLTHGGLSAYTLLVHDGRLVIIDLPQVVDVIGNSQGPEFRTCDGRRIGEGSVARSLPRRSDNPENLLAEVGMPRQPGTSQRRALARSRAGRGLS